MLNKIVTVHQPDFMPWFGFYNKISKSDIFIVLDHVLNNPNDGFWCKRVKMIIGGKPKWITVPLKKEKQRPYIPINQMEISLDMKKEFLKLYKTIVFNYTNHPYFFEIDPFLKEYFFEGELNLVKKNFRFILSTLSKLEINPKIEFSSNLSPFGSKNELLINLVKAVEGDHYLAGQGAKDYQNDFAFKNNGIITCYNSFKHPKYEQSKNHVDEFTEGLSIVDVVSSMGFSNLKRLLNEKA